MNSVLGDYIDKFALVYLDDIVRFKLITYSIQSKPMSPRHWYRTTRLI